MMQGAALSVHEPLGLTLEAWADMDEDEPGELVDGQLEEEEVPSVLHESVVVWFIEQLRRWAVPRGGRVFSSELKLGIGILRRGRKPDVSMYLPGSRLPAKGRSLIKRPPGVVIEVISPSPRDVRRDRIEKMVEYARFGVLYYWLLDPQLRMLEILELGARERYSIAFSASEGTHAVPGCEGLSLDLDALWAELDALPDDDEGAEE